MSTLPFDERAFAESVRLVTKKLSAGGIRLSKLDFYVVGAAQLLVAASRAALPIEDLEHRLERLRSDNINPP